MKRSSLMLAGAIALLLSNSAFAGKKSVNLDSGDFQAGLGAAEEPGLGVKLPSGGDAGAVIAVTLPRDFKKNSTARLRVFFYGASANCNYNLVPGVIHRRRVGLRAQFVGSSSSGFTAAVPGLTPAPATTNIVFAKDFKLAVATEGPIVGSQQAFDRVTLNIVRTNGATNPCVGDLYLTDGRLIYQTP